MYTPQPDVPSPSDGRSTIVPSLPLDNPFSFSFDMSGVASVLGGDDAIAAMTAVHVYGNGRWLGWYNSPGSFHLAKRLNSFAKSASFHHISSTHPSSETSHTHSVYMDFTTLLKLDGRKGPKFHAIRSCTIIQETGYLAALFMNECATCDLEGTVFPGRWTQPIGLTIADLGPAPASEVRPARGNASTLLSASIPITISISTCVLCAVCNDWYASSRILVGIVASGIFCFVLGSADFVLTYPESANGSLASCGILSSDKDMMLLRGTEGAINCITRGRLSLRFSCENHHNLIQFCSVLYFIQSITELFLILQPSLFGQVMYLTSLCVSALYNARLSSFNKEHNLRGILFERVLENPTQTKYTFGTRTTAVVFTLLVLQLEGPRTKELLNELLPDDAKVWRVWRATILEWLRHPSDQPFQLGGILEDLSGFTQEEKDLLGLLYEDARAAYNGYRHCSSRLPVVSN